MTGHEALDMAAPLGPDALRRRHFGRSIEAVSRVNLAGASRIVDWRPVNLRSVADDFECEDKAAAQHEDGIEQLARAMFAEFGAYMAGEWDAHPAARRQYTRVARALIAAGWTKDHIVDAEVIDDTTDQEN